MPSALFDDGSAAIPAATPAPPERVIVVGAGIAGLTAANALRTAGVECLVVEARDRIGGRLHTVEVDGVVADLGGAWIHHPGANVLDAWVRFAGVPFIADPNGTAFTGADLGEGRVLTPEELAGVGYAALDPVAAIVAADEAAGRPDRSALEVVEQHLATLPDGADRDRLRQLMASMIEQDAAGPLGDVSARWIFDAQSLVGDVVDNIAVDGYRSVLAPLAAGTRILLDRPVRRVVQTEEGVTVEGDGWSESGSHVVVTAPLGVLKAGAIEFVPPLHPERQAIVERAGFGSMEKVVVAFAEPFWQADGLNHAVIHPADRSQAAAWTWDYGRRAINFLIATSATGAAWADPRGWAVEQLECLWGSPLPAEPSGVVATDWLHDEYAHGSYSHVRPGFTDADNDALGEPLGRMLFAGEHTTGARGGYADGAMTSGLREAKRLLQRPAVELSAP
ncbi:MAG: FAD-dependent oxidoreductase [Microbacteriaceae bacterium]|nr:FAD-dependent oxidoreductase [Microbacteriaceae bacterium]